MRLYRLDYLDARAPSGHSAEWFTSKDAARSMRASIIRRRAEPGNNGVDLASLRIEAVNVPTTRLSLVAFLNRHAGVL